jgi:hypothetical protein
MTEVKVTERAKRARAHNCDYFKLSPTSRALFLSFNDPGVSASLHSRLDAVAHFAGSKRELSSYLVQNKEDI